MVEKKGEMAVFSDVFLAGLAQNGYVLSIGVLDRNGDGNTWLLNLVIDDKGQRTACFVTKCCGRIWIIWRHRRVWTHGKWNLGHGHWPKFLDLFLKYLTFEKSLQLGRTPLRNKVLRNKCGFGYSMQLLGIFQQATQIAPHVRFGDKCCQFQAFHYSSSRRVE